MRVIVSYFILGLGISLTMIFVNDLQACGSAHASPITHSEGYCAEVRVGNTDFYISTCSKSNPYKDKTCWYELHKE